MAKTTSTRHRWDITDKGSACTGEALDDTGKVLARVRITIEYFIGKDMFRYQGKAGLQGIEKTAEELARNAAEDPQNKR